jgi:flagellar motor switch protein FliN/FliY
MNTPEALVTLAETTAEAVLGVLSALCANGAEKGKATVVPAGDSPLESISYPVVATDVSYTDGVSGGNVFVITRLGARRLAAVMMSEDPPAEDSDEDLDDMTMSALGEAMNQMLAASAGALASALGYPVDISAPNTSVVQSADVATGIYPETPHATRVSFTVLGESCRLVQLIPNAFVVRMVRALEVGVAEEDPGGDRDEDTYSRLSGTLRDAPVRLSAELGRATVTLEQLADPRAGVVIELDRFPEDPVDLCVNGKRVATGELVLIDETEWALRIDRVLNVNPADLVSRTGRS